MNIISLLWLTLVTFTLAKLNTKTEVDVKLQTLEKATGLNKENGVIYMSGQEFNEVVKQPRDFSVVVALTVLDKSFECGPCKALDELLQEVGKQWSKNKDNDKLFIASLEYSKAPQVFAQYKLTTAPNLYVYPPNSKKTNEPEYIPFTGLKSGVTAEQIVEFINQSQDTAKINYKKPTDWIFVIMTASAFFIALGVTYFMYYKLGEILSSNRSWSAIAIIFLLTMLSGQMWNSIRGPSFANYKRDGNLEWYAGGFQDQLGLESQIVAVVYGIATFVLIKLGLRAPQIKSPKSQSLVSIILILIFVACIGFITALFKRKFPMYPYKVIFE